MKNPYIIKIKKNKTDLINLKKAKKRYIIYVADIETVIIKNKHIPFLIGYKQINTILLKSFKINFNTENFEQQSTEIILNFLKNLIDISKIKKNKKIFFYFHNLGNFDGIFLLKVINQNADLFNKIKVIIKNNRIYEIKLTENLYIRDSFTLLPLDLKTLSKNLLTEEKQKKEINYDFFKSITSVKQNINEIETYFKYDLISLSDIIENFQEEILQKYQINITTVLTISSLAFKIYRQNFMVNEEIYKSNIDNMIENFLRQSFIGGITTIFKPKCNNAYYYDVNSLYPYSMLQPMPIGKPNWKNINNLDINIFFGFIECTIEIPENLEIPPLSIKDKETGLLINPTGEITNIWFSEEIKNAIQNYNCKIIKIHKALEYEKKIIFYDYITHFYEYKKKKDQRYIFYKLLLNSLFGRFALKTELEELKFINKEDLYILNLFFNIQQDFPETNNKLKLTKIKIPTNEEILTEKTILNLNLSDIHKQKLLKLLAKQKINTERLNIAVQISAAITAYSRIFMINQMNQEIKNNNTIIYTDTDSIICTKPLASNKINEFEIGKFKLKTEIEQGIFFAPKVYFLKEKNKKQTWSITFKGLDKNEKNKLNISPENILNEIETNKKIKITKIQRFFNKSIKTFEITTKEQTLLFDLQNKKRKNIYNNNKEWIDTKPIHIKKK